MKKCFWKNKITNHLNSEIRKNKSSFLFNLASKEYFSVINPDKLDCKVISFDFKKFPTSYENFSRIYKVYVAIKKLKKKIISTEIEIIFKKLVYSKIPIK